MQLLPQLGGQVLLQGLSLAVHCGSLDSQLQEELKGGKHMSVSQLLGTVQLVEKGNNATCARRDLFTSQLTREHPVPFFQFLDICARSEQLDELRMLPLLHLFQNGSSRIGTKGLAELLSSPAAAAALGSALCSCVKLCVRHARQYDASNAPLAAAGDPLQGDERTAAPYPMSARVLLAALSSLGRASKAGVAVRSAVTRRTVALARPAQRRTLTKTAVAFDPQELQNIPKEVLLGGAAALAGLVGLIGYAAANNPAADMAGGEAAAAESAQAAAPAPLPRVNAVLVFGASGKLGRKVMERLVRSGRTVIAAVRSADKAAEVFEAAGLKEGYQQPSGNGSGSFGILITAAGVDVTNPATLSAELFEGVTQVVSALGPVAGRLPDGSFGYIDGMSPERVETQGMANIVAALAKHAPGVASAGSGISSSSILPMASAEDLAAWERLDDVIMGGNSSSALEAAADGSGAVWKGDLVVEGGGFCGARTKALDMDLSGYDGLQLRVKGDGQIFKFNIKTDQDATPESTYQATFDTSPEGDWTTVRLPWSSFVPVKQAQSDPNRGPLDPARISKLGLVLSSFVPVKQAQSDPTRGPLDPSCINKLGLVLSRFEFNKAPNPSYRPGKFQLAIDGSGISAYKAPRPAVVAISSAGVERNAIIGDDAAARKADIPIIQLNPGGVLNWKYEAECVLRASGLPYTVIRCTGLDDKGIEGPALLEADQGDTLIGVISRDEAADTVLAALARPEAANKTLELRRGEGAEAKGKSMNEARFNRLFLKLALDRNRWRVGLQPFPRAVPPPPPPSEERTKEILADPRVQAVKEWESKAKEAEGVKEKELAKANASTGAAVVQQTPDSLPPDSPYAGRYLVHFNTGQIAHVRPERLLPVFQQPKLVLVTAATEDYRRLARSQVSSSDVVLELGCSYGMATNMLAEHAAAVVGTDNSEEAVAEVGK
ncbi:hypothetical protein OEZ85_012388 [Tetradesmus obliquus]|uniref:NADH:ubiquinone oxidoreductase intermediate-associated protein 30 domain-containing protein n=1 Tax=Tetradesmus obliquus TaxID=3088 RepID=A0ABY8TTL6_TETOB|nr:hypothetical protein OEZ85_012388 [Tetradesmus obliquus]